MVLTRIDRTSGSKSDCKIVMFARKRNLVRSYASITCVLALISLSLIMPVVWYYNQSNEVLAFEKLKEHQKPADVRETRVPSATLDALTWSMLLDRYNAGLSPASRTVTLGAIPSCSSGTNSKEMFRACKSNCTMEKNYTIRLWEIVTSSKFALTRPQLDAILSLTSSLPVMENVIVTAGGTTRYSELIYMLANLGRVFKHTPFHFRVVVFDLGLTGQERVDLETTFQCQIVDLPLHMFPLHVRDLGCKGWSL
ncbi:uncharacterized protein LOC131946305 [Physella acuta]|uniref:uncharacterized protein LOC131946305 n=1 Tax=Physella acuta TaxID=109671 RepID=UPI0027DD3E60|nr:uncharacterized protein LOC131946305 [Physella acuta]